MTVTHNIGKRLVGLVATGFPFRFNREAKAVSKAMRDRNAVCVRAVINIFMAQIDGNRLSRKRRTNKRGKDQRFIKHEKTLK